MTDKRHDIKRTKNKCRSRTKSKIVSTVHCDDNHDMKLVISDLFHEVLNIAEEDDLTSDKEAFVKFVIDMLPSDVLNQLMSMAGFQVDDTEFDRRHEIDSDCNQPRAFIEDVWMERYADEQVTNDDESQSKSINGSSFQCEICDRIIRTTEHHLYPKEVHSKLRKRDPNQYTQEKLSSTASLCRMCHSAIHRFYTNNELADNYYSIELLMESEKVFKFAKWASTLQGRGNLRTK